MAKTVSFGGTDWDADQQAIDQRRKLAIALMQQSAMVQPTETAGGIAVRQSPLSGLARVLTGVVGKQDLDAADSEQRDLQSRKSAMLADWLERMPKATTEQQLMGDRPGAGSFENVTKQPGLNDYMQWASQGALMGPQAGQIGQTGLNMAMNQQQRADQREFQASQAEESRKQRQLELMMTLEDRSVGREEKLAAQKELMQLQLEGRKQIAQIAGALKQPPAPHPVTVIGEDGRAIVKDARTGQTYGLSPQDTKLQGAFNADTASLSAATGSFDRLAEAANELKNHPGIKGITGLRGALPNIPGSSAADAEAKLNTLKSQVAFGVLQDMRNNSKTGGALGAVSDAEGKRLEANLAALEKAQSTDQMVQSLDKILQYTEGAKDRLRAAYNLKHGGKQAPTEKPAGAKFLGFE